MITDEFDNEDALLDDGSCPESSDDMQSDNASEAEFECDECANQGFEQGGESVDDETLDEDGPEITDDELDRIADTAIAALKDILKYFNVGEVTIDEYEGDDGELILDITGDDLAILIGRHGRTLEALQSVISAITVRGIGYRFPVIVDIEGYKGRQRQKLESLARSAAKKAAATHRSVKLRPMNPYERRIIHITLRDDVRVETGSEGEGSARHVVVVPIKNNF